MYGKMPHTPIFGPICVPYPKGLNCWFHPCKTIPPPHKCISQVSPF